MGRDLTITYYPNREKAYLAMESPKEDFELKSDTSLNLEEELRKNLLIHKAHDEAIEYDEYHGKIRRFRNVDVPAFCGTRKALRMEIADLIVDSNRENSDEDSYEEDNDNYVAIGYYSLILADFPDNYDYVVIEND